MRGGRVSFQFEWESPLDDDLEPVTLEVEAEVSDYHPAVMHQRNGDPGWPADGGQVEELRFFGPDGREWDEETPCHVWRREGGSTVASSAPLRVAVERALDAAVVEQLGHV